ncbi:MAG: calcium/sodium antiporter [Acidobacteria bacterium]|nr:calcium/sodium antiporter [Acidobacteriota bacterium]
MTILLFIIGIILLVVGAELLVRGASRLAVAIGISPLVIGLTIVAFGTSAPEMAVSVASALSGQAGADIAIGNVVGSNIFNVLLILGLSAMIAPLVVSQQLVRIDVPVMIAASGLMLLFAMDRSISRLDGAVLFGGIVGYTIFAIVKGRQEQTAVQEEYENEFGKGRESSVPVNVLLIIGGLAMLVLGSNWLVDGAIAIARTFGVSELVIGLTIVAAGTSLPEVATSVMASIRGERDIAVGNVVGSNIFNILAVLGLASIVSPAGVNVSGSALAFDIPVMIAVAIACLPIFFTGYAIARWEGLVFLCYYVAYTVLLVMTAGRHEAADELRWAMLLFVIPLTVLTLIVTTTREVRKRRG